MKILQIVPYFYPAWSFGGPAKLVYDTSLQFAQLDHQVTVLTTDAYTATMRMPKKYQHTSYHPNCKVLYEKNLSPLLAHRSRLFFRPSTLFKIPWLVLSSDVIHLHDFFTIAHLGTFVCAVAFSKPYIISVHGTLESKSMLQKSLIKAIYLKTLGRFFLRHARYVIATSASETTTLESYGVDATKIVRIGHGVSHQEFATKLTLRQARLKLKLPTTGPVITFLGRIHLLKGMDLLEQVILKADRKLQFVIAGSDDGYLSHLKKTLKSHKNVHFMGPQFGDQKAALFGATTIFLYPSHSEGFSLGILEALSVGLPTIITKGCHFDELATAKAGIVVPTTAPALLQAVEKLVANPTHQQELSQTAKMYIQKKYSFEVIITKLITLYEDACTRKKV